MSLLTPHLTYFNPRTDLLEKRKCNFFQKDLQNFAQKYFEKLQGALGLPRFGTRMPLVTAGDTRTRHNYWLRKEYRQDEEFLAKFKKTRSG